MGGSGGKALELEAEDSRIVLRKSEFEVERVSSGAGRIARELHLFAAELLGCLDCFDHQRLSYVMSSVAFIYHYVVNHCFSLAVRGSDDVEAGKTDDLSVSKRDEQSCVNCDFIELFRGKPVGFTW